MSEETSACVRERERLCMAQLYRFRVQDVTSGHTHTYIKTHTHTENCGVTIPGRPAYVIQHPDAVKSVHPHTGKHFSLLSNYCKFMWFIISPENTVFLFQYL